MNSNTRLLLARNVINLGMGQVATTAISIVYAAVIGRALEPAAFGVLYIALAIGAFAGVIADWGQGTSLVREVARGRADEPELIGAALLVRLLSTVSATIMAGAIAFGLGYDEQIVMLALLAMIVGSPNIVSAPFSLAFRAKDRMGIDALAGVVNKAAALIATVGALHFGGGLKALLLAQGVGALASLALVMFFVLRDGLTVKYPTWSGAAEVFRIGAPIVLFSLVIGSQPFLEVMILSALTSTAVVGWYGASRTVTGIILSPAMILTGASFPELTRAAQIPGRLRQMMDASARVLYIVAAFVASFLYLFADHLIAIIYSHGRFEGAPDILRVSATVVPLLFLVMLLSTALWAVGRSRAMVVISIFRICFCAIASWFLIGLFQERLGNGAIGLVVIGGVAEIPAVIASMVILTKEVARYTLLLNLARTYLTAIIVVAAVTLLHPTSLWYLAPIFSVVFAVVAMATRLIQLSDLRMAIEVARSRLLPR